MKIAVNIIEVKENNQIVFNAMSTEGNMDWIRAARLKKEKKIEEYNKIMNEPMYREIDIN